MLVDQCATLRHAHAVKAVEYWTQLADGETSDSTIDPRPPASGLHASTTLDGAVRLDGNLGPIDGEIVTKELRRLEREQYLADQAAGVTRPASARLAAALVEMETILFDGPLTVIAASTARSFTGRLRRAIEVRDRHCQHPSGCDVAAPDCDVDHIVPVAAGGTTTQFTANSSAAPTTATPPSTTTAPPRTRSGRSPSSTRSAPASAGATSTKTTNTPPRPSGCHRARPKRKF